MSDATSIIQRMKEAVTHENGKRQNVIRWKLSRPAYEDYIRSLSEPPKPPAYKDASGVIYYPAMPPVPPLPPTPEARRTFANAEIVVSDDSRAPYLAYDTTEWR